MDQPANSPPNLPVRYFLLFVPVLSFLVGFVVFLAWIFDIEVLKRFLPTLPAMNPITALSFILLAIGFFVYHLKTNQKIKLAVVSATTLTVFFSSLTRLSQILNSSADSIDLLLFKEQILGFTTAPSRMAEATALSFICLSVSLLLLTVLRNRLSYFVSQALAVITFVLTTTALFFYAFSNFLFLETKLFFSMAVHTSLLLFLLSVSLFFILKNSFKRKIWLLHVNTLAIVLLIITLLWQGLIQFERTRVASDFSYEAEIFSVDNFYDQEKNQYSGEILSNTTFRYDLISFNRDLAEIKNVFEVRRPNGDLIINVERLYGINPQTTAHVSNAGDKNREGYLFAPPNLKKENFTYWHVNYNQALNMRFVQEEEVLGLTTYVYQTKFQTDQTQDLTYLEGVGSELGISLDVSLTLWVEPKTGRMIKYEDDATAYYYDLSSNVRLTPWNKFSNEFTLPSTEEQVYATQQIIQTNTFVEILIPMTLYSITLILFVIVFIQRFTKVRTTTFIPVITLIVCLLSTTMVWIMARQTIKAQNQTKFENEIATIEDTILDRLTIYQQTLQGVHGLFGASEVVSREEYATYIDTLNVTRNFPGAQSFGYMKIVEQADTDQFINQVRSEGFTDFEITSTREGDSYAVVTYIEPLDERNRRALGYDGFSEEIRFQALNQARDEGSTVVSGKVTLVQETTKDVQAGFIMFLPIYDESETNVDSIQERRDYLTGYVQITFRMDDLMRNILRDQKYHIDVEIFDGTNPSTTSLMYDQNSSSSTMDENNRPLFKKQKTIDVYGHQWTINFATLPEYGVSAFQEAFPNIILAMGIALTFVFTLAAYSLSSTGVRAEKIAESITKDLKQKTKELDSFNKKLSAEVEQRKETEEVLSKKTEELTRINKLMVNRELKMVELKNKLKKNK